jgi:hypothetical protein
VVVEDEWARYMAMPTPTNTNDCVLAWWAEQQKHLPNVARMARQFLASQASSASVERLFSKAGLVHTDLRKRLSEEQMAHILMASINT